MYLSLSGCVLAVPTKFPSKAVYLKAPNLIVLLPVIGSILPIDQGIKISETQLLLLIFVEPTQSPFQS